MIGRGGLGHEGARGRRREANGLIAKGANSAAACLAAVRSGFIFSHSRSGANAGCPAALDGANEKNALPCAQKKSKFFNLRSGLSAQRGLRRRFLSKSSLSSPCRPKLSEKMASFDQKRWTALSDSKRAAPSRSELLRLAQTEIDSIDDFWHGYDDARYDDCPSMGHAELESLLLPQAGKWPPLLVTFSTHQPFSPTAFGWGGLFSSRGLAQEIKQLFGQVASVRGRGGISCLTTKIAKHTLADKLAEKAEMALQAKSLAYSARWRRLWNVTTEGSSWPLRCLWIPLETGVSGNGANEAEWAAWEQAARSAATQILGAPARWAPLRSTPDVWSQTAQSELVARFSEDLLGTDRAARKERQALRAAMRDAEKANVAARSESSSENVKPARRASRL